MYERHNLYNNCRNILEFKRAFICLGLFFFTIQIIPFTLKLLQNLKIKRKRSTYMSIIDEPVFGGNLVGDLGPSGYVDRPRISVELLSHCRSQPREQQDQQRPK